jgi:hypothetical protein
MKEIAGEVAFRLSIRRTGVDRSQAVFRHEA